MNFFFLQDYICNVYVLYSITKEYSRFKIFRVNKQILMPERNQCRQRPI